MHACYFAGVLLLHGINLDDRLGLLRVVGLDVDLEVGHGDTEILQQRRLVAVQDLARAAHGASRRKAGG